MSSAHQASALQSWLLGTQHCFHFVPLTLKLDHKWSEPHFPRHIPCAHTHTHTHTTPLPIAAISSIITWMVRGHCRPGLSPDLTRPPLTSGGSTSSNCSTDIYVQLASSQQISNTLTPHLTSSGTSNSSSWPSLMPTLSRCSKNNKPLNPSGNIP